MSEPTMADLIRAALDARKIKLRELPLTRAAIVKVKYKGCPSFTGWEDEGISYCDKEVGPNGTHDGLHSYPVISAVQPQDEVEIMEEVLKKVIECFEANIKITEALVSDLKKVLGNGLPVPPATKRGKKAAEEPKTEPPATTTAVAPAVASGEPKPHAEGGALQVKDVTIEMIRERSTVYSDSKNFGMDAWLALAQKVTGQKKVKDIPKEMYGAFYGAMDADLEKLKHDREPLSKPSLPPATPIVETPAAAAKVEPSLDQLRAKGKEFMDRNGQDALIALVKAFGATKLSEIAKEKYPAFLEAISNA